MFTEYTIFTLDPTEFRLLGAQVHATMRLKVRPGEPLVFPDSGKVGSHSWEGALRLAEGDHRRFGVLLENNTTQLVNLPEILFRIALAQLDTIDDIQQLAQLEKHRQTLTSADQTKAIAMLRELLTQEWGENVLRGLSYVYNLVFSMNLQQPIVIPAEAR